MTQNPQGVEALARVALTATSLPAYNRLHLYLDGLKEASNSLHNPIINCQKKADPKKGQPCLTGMNFTKNS